MPNNRFLSRHREDSDLNQYWYSTNTINVLVGEVEDHIGQRIARNEKCMVALISTPSIYFSISSELRSHCKVLDVM
jgi:hypothetical protein